MFRAVPSKVSFPQEEEAVLERWRTHDIFKKSLDARAQGPRFRFYEGPPTANGSPGIHHVLARTFKDVIPRYRAMKGYYVLRKGGWDTHGLPVELEVEKSLGISSKPQIEAFGIAEFNALCRESVFRYVKEWEQLTERIGFWIDLDDAYVTYRTGYIQSCWWILKQFWDAGLIYRDYKVTPHCPRCGTSLSSHEVALGYREDTSDPSLYVKLRVRPDQEHPVARQLAGGKPAYLLIWTTTPWTLPGNVAAAVAPDAQYVAVDLGEELLILAEALVASAIPGEYGIAARFRGDELAGLEYEPLYRFVPLDRPAHRVVTGDFVSMEDGTGIVHIAPAFGEIDLQVGRQENLPIVQTVDLRGKMTPETGSFAEKFVKDADPVIVRDLRQRGLVLRSERILHTYPFCWRCDTPLLYYAKTSWYIRTTAVKEKMLSANEQIGWYPEHIKSGRFGDWLKNNVDWAISRERYWGTPLPVWTCEQCQRSMCIGSLDELRQKAVDPSIVTADFDLHRPTIDTVLLRCDACEGVARRELDLVDVWFDSGAMPVAQWHFPADNITTFVENFPADFICEALDQTRGWFYSLHAISTLLFSRPSYHNVICLGLVLDENGQKMSKHKGNVIDPWDVIGRYGADAVRWYLLTSTTAGEPKRFSEKRLLDEVVRQFFLTLWNTYSFFTTYARLDDWTPAKAAYAERNPTSKPLLDRWILSELNQLILDVDHLLEQYDPTTAGRRIQGFVDDLSNWYVRRSRRRFWKSESDVDKLSAYSTLYEVLITVTKLMAPFAPFLSESIYQNLARSVDPSAPESVHLSRFPVADRSVIEERLMHDMRLVMRVVSIGRAARSKAKIRVRQPLQEVLVKARAAEESEAIRRLADLITDELNVKRLRLIEDGSQVLDYSLKPRLDVLGPKHGKDVGRIASALRNLDTTVAARAIRSGTPITVEGFEVQPAELLVETRDRPGYSAVEEAGYVVGLPTEIPDELREEGLAREIVHLAQSARKNAGFEIADRIELAVFGPETVKRTIERFGQYVAQETLADRVAVEEVADSYHREDHEVEGTRLTIGVRRTRG